MATFKYKQSKQMQKKRSSLLPLRFKNFNFILSVGCNNEKKLSLTLKFTLAKDNNVEVSVKLKERSFYNFYKLFSVWQPSNTNNVSKGNKKK